MNTAKNIMAVDRVPEGLELRQIDVDNVGLFARRRFAAGEVVFKEEPFYVFDKMQMMMDPTGGVADPADRDELQTLLEQMFVFANTHGHKQGMAKFPPEAQAVMDRLIEIKTADEFRRCSKNVQEKWMALHDAHHLIPEGRDFVVVAATGLTSEAGQRLNGRIGRVVGGRGELSADGITRRWPAEFVFQDGQRETKKLKAQNLKTPGGVFRSNAFDEGLFEYRCRMNHSCSPNVVADEIVVRGRKRMQIVAVRDIAVGDEVTCCYIEREGLNTAQRRELLQGKYNFLCQCQRCGAA